jgi:predicted XRE-type DNA-binding protein
LPVRKDLGIALFVVQIGGTPPSAKPWKELGPGVLELIDAYRGDTYRIVKRGADRMARRTSRRGTHNVLVDLGFSDAEELTAKAILAKKINEIIAKRGLTQSAAAVLLGMPQPKISAIRNYKVRGISLERLMQGLTALGQNVEIVVTPSRNKSAARIAVAA